MANGTKFVEVTTTGPVEWMKVFESNRDMDGYEGSYTDCEGAYTLVQVLDKAQFEKLKKAGSQKKPIQSRMMDGVIAVKFERKHKVTTKNGDVIAKAGGAPKVVGPDGKTWDIEKDGLIGNGTIAEVTNLIQTFGYVDKEGKPQKTSRTALTKIKIVELVVYERQEEETE